jgi:hypothetical protein
VGRCARMHWCSSHQQQHASHGSLYQPATLVPVLLF